jgi:hypothetical protein
MEQDQLFGWLDEMEDDLGVSVDEDGEATEIRISYSKKDGVDLDEEIVSRMKVFSYELASSNNSYGIRKLCFK